MDKNRIELITRKKLLNAHDIQIIGNIGYMKALKIMNEIRKNISDDHNTSIETMIPTKYIIQYFNLKGSEIMEGV